MRKAVVIAAALALVVGCSKDAARTGDGVKVPAAACDGWAGLRDVVDKFPPTGDIRQDVSSRAGAITQQVFKLMAAAQDAAGITEANAGSEAVKSDPLYPLALALGRIWQGRGSEQFPNDYFGSTEMVEDIATVDRFCKD